MSGQNGGKFIRVGNHHVLNYDFYDDEDEVRYQLGSQLLYVCEGGYTLVGNAKALCRGEGRWFGPYMNCSAMTCPFPGNVPNSHSLPQHDYHYSDIVHYSCHKGYVLLGNKSRECTSMGSWSGRLPGCIPVKCPNPSRIEDGKVEGKDNAYGSVIYYSCDKGYRLVGEAERKCGKDGRWMGLEPYCQEVYCRQLNRTANVYFNTTNTVYDTFVQFRCVNDSKALGDIMYTVCGADGKWSHPVAHCYSQCKIPQPISGHLNQHLAKVGENVDQGYVLNVTCDADKELTQAPRCDNGRWSVEVECINSTKPCNKVRPHELRDGYYRFHTIKDGAQALYYCYPGYQLEGNNLVVCQNGKWVGNTNKTVCREKYCAHPGILNNGTIFLEGVEGKFENKPYIKTFKHHQRIEYKCDKEFTLVGTLGSVCVDGRWRPVKKPTCELRRHLPWPHFKFFL